MDVLSQVAGAYPKVFRLGCQGVEKISQCSNIKVGFVSLFFLGARGGGIQSTHSHIRGWNVLGLS